MEIIEKIRDEIKKIISETKIGAITNQRLGNILLMLTDYDLYKKLRQDKGYFASIDALKAQHPYPRTGDVASAGTPYPGYIVRCDIDGYWTQTGERPIAPVYDNADYVHRGGDEVINGKKTFTSPIKSATGVDRQDVMTVGQYNDKKDVAGGYAGLDENRHIDTSLIPIDYRRGYGYRLNVLTDYLVIQRTKNLIFGKNDFSIHIKINVKDVLQDQFFYETEYCRLGTYNGRLRFDLGDGVFYQCDFYDISSNTDYDIFAVREGYNLKLYINELPVVDVVKKVIIDLCDSKPIKINFIGEVYLIRIFNRALSQSDVSYYSNNRNLRFEDIGASNDELIINTELKDATAVNLRTGWFIDNGQLIAKEAEEWNSASLETKKYLSTDKYYTFKFSVQDFRGSIMPASIGDLTYIQVASSGNYSVTRIKNEIKAPHSIVQFWAPNTLSCKIDNVSVTQVGCVMELLPENATKTKWIETQNGLHASVIGNPSINSGSSINEIQISDLTTTNIAAGIANKEFILPEGWYVQSIYMHSPKVLTKVQCVSNALYSQIPLLIDKEIGGGGYLFNISADQVIYTSPTILRFNACGNIDNILSISIKIKKAL